MCHKIFLEIRHKAAGNDDGEETINRGSFPRGHAECPLRHEQGQDGHDAVVTGHLMVVFPQEPAQGQAEQRTVGDQEAEGANNMVADVVFAHEQARHQEIADEIGFDTEQLPRFWQEGSNDKKGTQ